MLRRSSAAIAAVLFFALAGSARSAGRPADLGGLLEPVRVKYNRPALAAAVTNSEGLLAIGATGVRKIGSDVPVRLDDRFHIGSCTKSMTATMIASLVEEGKLSWDTTVGETFRDFVGDIDPGFRDVTLAQLLFHRSGLPEDRTPDTEIFPALRRLEGPIRDQRRELVRLVMGRKPAATPGSRMQYANYGYAVAGAMAEAVTGQPWEQLMRERLFGPLGMTTAGFGSPGSRGKIDQPLGHRLMFGRLQPLEPGPAADNPEVIGPAGTVHCSIGDFARYARLHLRAERGDAQLLSKASFKTLHSDPYQQGYAMGWKIVERPWAGGRALMHGGSNGSFFAVVWIAPAKDIAIVVATNSGDPDAFKACDEAIGLAIARFVE